MVFLAVVAFKGRKIPSTTQNNKRSPGLRCCLTFNALAGSSSVPAVIEDFVAHGLEDVHGLLVVIQRVGNEDEVDLLLVLLHNAIQRTGMGGGGLKATERPIEVDHRFDGSELVPADRGI